MSSLWSFAVAMITGEPRNRVGLAEAPQDVQAAHPGHHHVEQDEVEPTAGDVPERRRPVGGDRDLVPPPLQPACEALAVGLVVVDDQ